MIAIMSGSVSLAGLLLIFCGFLFSRAASFPSDTTDDEIIDRYKNAARYGLAPFLLSLLITGICLAWLVRPSPGLYNASWVGFLVLLGVTGIYGTVVVWRYR